MEDIREIQTEAAPPGRVRMILRTGYLVVMYVGEQMLDAAEVNWRIIRRESDLFLGVVLTIVGIFDFHSGKYCDGNTADYLSCTRPTTFYYYGLLETLLIIAGVTFILLWFFKPRKK